MVDRTQCVFHCLRQSLAVPVVLAAMASPGLASAADVISTGFEGQSRGPYTEADLYSHLPSTDRVQDSSFPENALLSGIVPNGGGNNSLKIRFPRGIAGYQHSGITARIGFPDGAEYGSLTLEYDFRFTPTGNNQFDFSRGGKLPGLGSDTTASGGNHPFYTGVPGFTARYMWRSGGNLAVYLYARNYLGGPTGSEGQKYGEDIPLYWPDGSPVKPTPGTWYNIKQRIYMNTPGLANGGLRVLVNDQQVLRKTDIEYRAAWEYNKIDNLYLTSFPGGNDSSWAPAHTQFLNIDNIRVYE